MFRRICTFLYAVVVVSVMLFTLNLYRVHVDVSNNMFILPNIESDVVYEQTSDNTMKCDLATFSNIVNRMRDEDYMIANLVVDSDQIDITLNKKEVYYRMVYRNDGSFVSIGNPYEKSFVPLTYIIEE